MYTKKDENTVLIAEKGYTFEVVSWENDGDNYRTIRKHFKQDDDFSLQIALLEANKNSNHSQNLSNICDDESVNPEGIAILRKIFAEHMSIEKHTDEDISDMYIDIMRDFLGSSEYYRCRVCENFFVFHLEDDIYGKYYEY